MKMFFVLLLSLSAQAHAAYNSFGEALKGLGYTKTICVGEATDTHPRQPVFGVFDPTQLDLNKRYGLDLKHCAGNYVGERMSPDPVVAVIKHPSNPLNMISNQSYGLSPQHNPACGSVCMDGQDALDVVYVSKGGSQINEAYDNYFLPTYNQLYPSTTTTTTTTTLKPVPSPSPSPSPSPVVCPTPSPSAATCGIIFTASLKETAELAPDWVTIGPGRKARLTQLRNWVRSCK